MITNRVIEFKGMPLFQKARFRSQELMQGEIKDFACFFYMTEGTMASYDARGLHELNAKEAGTFEFKGAVCDERFCNVNVKGFNKISEKLTNYDQAKMNLAYEVVEGMPGFVTKAVNDWTIVPISDKQSKLVMKGMIEKKMNETLETILMMRKYMQKPEKHLKPKSNGSWLCRKKNEESGINSQLYAS